MHNQGINSQVYFFQSICFFFVPFVHFLYMQLHFSFSSLRWTIQVIKAKCFVFIRKYQERCFLRRQFLFSYLHSVYKQTNITAPEIGYYPYVKIYPNRVPTPDRRDIYMCRCHIDMDIPIPSDNRNGMGIPCNFNTNPGLKGNMRRECSCHQGFGNGDTQNEGTPISL